MPSMTHEGLVAIFRECPELAAHLLRAALDLPERVTPRIDATTLSELEPAEYRADVVVTFADDSGTVQRAAIIEIQLSRSPSKRKSWPSYAVGVHTRLDCPVVLVVVTLEPALARQNVKQVENRNEDEQFRADCERARSERPRRAEAR